MSINVLAGLLDEKLIRIMSLFLKYPDKKFYMSEVSKLSKVNNATTFRTLNKLVKEDFIRSQVIGKVRTYQLSSSERAKALAKLLKRTEKDSPSRMENKDPISLFIEKVRGIQKIRLIIEESKSSNSVKLIIVSEFPSKERIERIVKEIKSRKGFQINFVEITPSQYDGLKRTIGENKKVLFKR